jgi:hypothetical protein
MLLQQAVQVAAGVWISQAGLLEPHLKATLVVMVMCPLICMVVAGVVLLLVGRHPLELGREALGTVALELKVRLTHLPLVVLALVVLRLRDILQVVEVVAHTAQELLAPVAEEVVGMELQAMSQQVMAVQTLGAVAAAAAVVRLVRQMAAQAAPALSF